MPHIYYYAFLFSPSPTITWSKLTDSWSKQTGRVRFENFNRTMVIEDVRLEDAGTYECAGVNSETPDPVRNSFQMMVEGEILFMWLFHLLYIL